MTVVQHPAAQAAPTRYLSCAETAKLIRQALRQAFPGFKFAVRSSTYSGGASITVSYVDGPARADVERIAGTFAGAHFDGTTDYKGGHVHAFADKPLEPVHFGADFVFVRQELSEAQRAAAAADGPAGCGPLAGRRTFRRCSPSPKGSVLMSEPHPPAALASQLVVQFGERVFGVEWQRPFGRLAGVNQRTMSRIKAAAQEGREYPAARGALAALYAVLAEVLQELEPHGRRREQSSKGDQR